MICVCSSEQVTKERGRRRSGGGGGAAARGRRAAARLLLLQVIPRGEERRCRPTAGHSTTLYLLVPIIISADMDYSEDCHHTFQTKLTQFVVSVS